MTNPGKFFRQAIKNERPLQIAGCINAYVALMAEQIGFKAIYLSGAGVANASYGLPDLALTTLDNVLEDARRITSRVQIPLLVDIDTGWGSALMIARTIKEMERAGVAAVHMEDQAVEKRCGHRPGKALASTEEMTDRIKAAVDAKINSDFVLMARTDALASEGLEASLARALAYQEAGADMIFVEAATSLSDYTAFKNTLSIPILANMTEFGKSPLSPLSDLEASGVDMVLYPLSANRAMNKAAWEVLSTIRTHGTQENCLDNMQTRQELYEILDYYNFEAQLDSILQKTAK